MSLNDCVEEEDELHSGMASSCSEGLHGGLRRLAHFEVRLVRETLGEREVLLQKAPHIMWPLRFRLPHQKHLRPTWMIRTGLFLYDNLAKRVSLPKSKKMKNPADSPLVSSIATCFEYSDGWVDDARLVVLNAMAAREKGAHVLTRTECIRAEKGDEYWTLTMQQADGELSTLTCSTIVNATGPWAISFIDRVTDTPNPNSMRMVKGSHIIVPKMYESDEAYILQNEDDRIVFVIPYEDNFTLIGTTDEDFRGDPSNAAISQDEIDYLVNISNSYFKTKFTQDDIVHSYSGVRPLLEEANASAQELTRDYKVEVHGKKGTPTLVNIFGGKITTFRKLAQYATNRIMPLFGSKAKPWTKDVALPGGDFTNKQALKAMLLNRFPWLTEQMVNRFVRQYGTLCYRFLDGKSSLADLGLCFGHGLYQAEVDYLIADEWAMTVEDILWRRTKTGLLLGSDEKAVLKSYVDSHVNKSDDQHSLKKVG